MLSAVLSISTCQISNPSLKQRIAIPDRASKMDPEGSARYLTDAAIAIAHGNRKGPKGMQRRIVSNKQLLESTLGCKDIMMEIMSFFSDQDLLDQFMKYLCNFPDLVNVESCLPILMQRRVWYCNSDNQLEFLHECMKERSIIPNTELVLGFPAYSDRFTSTIEKFSSVNLKSISITKRQVVDLMNASTSKIQHLKFTNFKLKDPESQLPSSRIIKITPYMKKMTFNNESSSSIFSNFKFKFRTIQSSQELKEEVKKEEVVNPIYSMVEMLDLISSNIEELEFPNQNFSTDISLIQHLGPKLTKLVLAYPDKTYVPAIAPNLEYFESNRFPSLPIETNVLCVHNPTDTILKQTHISEKVKKIIFHNCVLVCCELRPFLIGLVKCYPNCEELVIPETFLSNISKADLKEQQEITSSLKRIIIKHSSSAQPSKYGALRFALQHLFSKTVILFETIQKDERHFETHSSSNRTIAIDCYEDTLFKRIESTEKHFKVMDNSYIKEQIGKIKKQFIKSILSNNFSKFPLIENSLNILEGLKLNKQLMLQTIHQAIENYHDIFDNDHLYQAITNQFDICFSIIEVDFFNETLFSESYSELEVLFHQMIHVIEQNGYPSKVLFNEQWFNDQIVEIYGTLQCEQIQVYEDSVEEMENASLEIELEEEMEEINYEFNVEDEECG